MSEGTSETRSGNHFDRMEWAGAFGGLGTLIPFVVAYIAVVKVEPFGILFSFGSAMVASVGSTTEPLSRYSP